MWITFLFLNAYHHTKMRQREPHATIPILQYIQVFYGCYNLGSGFDSRATDCSLIFPTSSPFHHAHNLVFARMEPCMGGL